MITINMNTKHMQEGEDIKMNTTGDGQRQLHLVAFACAPSLSGR